MSLSVSATGAEGIGQQSYQTSTVVYDGGTSFQDVMLKTYGSQSTESMDVIFKEAANRYGISENLLKAVAKAESNFNPNAVSSAGAQGVMQLMPATAKSLGVEDSFDARQNIMAGAKYLKSNLDKFGDVSLALAAYNAGSGNVQKYGGIPPFSETQSYVKKVMSYMGQEVDIPANKLYVNSSVQESKISNLGNQLDLSALWGDSDNDSSIFSLNGISSLFGTGSSSNLLSLLFSNCLNVSEDGTSLTMDKEDMSNLLQMMRIQMMMEADQSVGTIL